MSMLTLSIAYNIGIGIEGNRITSAADVKDIWWSTFTCPYGWSVQGIWPVKDAVGPNASALDYAAVARSNSFEKVCINTFILCMKY